MNPIKNNLMALGSAAVLAVYSAGYLRTRSAAERFTGEDEGRRGAVAATPHVPEPAPDLPVAIQHVTVTPVRDTAPRAAKPASVSPSRAVATVAVADSAASPHAAADTAGVAARIVDSTPAPQVVAAVAPLTPSPGTHDSAASTAPAGDSAKSAEQAHGQFKDGVYTGWGSSRHGDIQASVEIRDGRIVSASITQCLMHYSCSWISPLPPQVVARQSPEVDYISGATQSTNAFYYAVVDALSKAK